MQERKGSPCPLLPCLSVVSPAPGMHCRRVYVERRADDSPGLRKAMAWSSCRPQSGGQRQAGWPMSLHTQHQGSFRS